MSRFITRHRCAVFITGLAVLVGLVAPSVALAQSQASSTIFGVIRDTTAGTLPGVTVTLTSPALQVPFITAVSGTEGDYRFRDLPAGEYKLVYELSGFTKVIRSEVRLTVGFQAKIDVTLPVGGMTEAITVSGESPIVDVASTSTGATLTRETIESIPRTKEFSALMTMTPGAIAVGAPDVGGSNLTGRYEVAAFGVQAQPKLSVEGINTTTGSGTNSAVVFSSFNFDEVKVSTSGADAETSTPGVSVVAVLKSGSNTFKGSLETFGQHPKLQSENLDSVTKAQGITVGSALDKFYGVAADLGGFLIKDRLWFYGGVNRQTRVENSLGFVANAGPDGKYLTGDEPAALTHTTLAGATAKVSYQLSRQVRLIGVYQRGSKIIPEFNASRFIPLESMDNYLDPTWVWKGEMQASPSSKLLFNVTGGWGGYVADHNGIRGAEAFFGADKLSSLVSRLYAETGLNTGPNVNVDHRPRSRYQLDSSVTFFPDRTMWGHHEFKVGESIYWENTYTSNVALPWGSYRLTYDLVNNVHDAPYSITIYNYPTDPRNRLDTYAGYIKDAWRVNNRLTLNLGVRYERQHAYLPAQSYPGSPEFPTVFKAADFAFKDVLTWNKVMPRVGVAFQLASKSVVKATWGIYANTAGDDFAETYNGNSAANAVFRWRDLNGDNRYNPGETNFSLTGADFLSITAASNSLINPDLKQPTTTESSASWEQELTKLFAARVQIVHKKVENTIATVNVLRPYSAYANAITRQDPGPDGVAGNSDDGGLVTLYDYTNAYRGATFVGNQAVNSSTPATYNSIETGLSKRMSSNWSAQFSYFATKTHALINAVPQSPNQDLYNMEDTWQWGMTLSGIYRLPWGFQASAFLQAKSGNKGERTYVFRNIPNSGTITARLGPRGSLNNPAFKTVNAKLNRSVKVRNANLDLTFEVFNIFNANTPTNITKASGSTYGFYTGVLAPRVAQLGVRFSF